MTYIQQGVIINFAEQLLSEKEVLGLAASRNEQAAKTRKKLVETAKRAFSEKGYKGTSIRALSKSIGVSESLLYHYFPNGKRELLAEVIQNELPALKKDMYGNDFFGAYDNLQITDAVEHFFFELNDFINEHIDIIRISLLEKEVRDYLIHNEMSKYLQVAEEAFEVFFEKRKAKGEIDCSDCKAVAMMAKAMMLNNVLFSVLGISIPNEIPIDRRKEVMSEILKVRKEVN